MKDKFKKILLFLYRYKLQLIFNFPLLKIRWRYKDAFINRYVNIHIEDYNSLKIGKTQIMNFSLTKAA